MPRGQKITLSAASILLGISLLLQVAHAQVIPAENATSLVVSNPNIWMNIPTSLSLPATFVDPINDIYIHRYFDPNDINNQIRVYDFRNTGGFYVTFQLENFIHESNPANIINATDLSLVTLAPVGLYPIATAPYNTPPADDDGTVVALHDCDWDFVTGSFESACASDFIQYGGVPIELMNGATLPPGHPGRFGEYGVSLGLRLLIPAAMPSGNYQSTFTFTLY